MNVDFIAGIYGEKSDEIGKLVSSNYKNCQIKRIKNFEEFSKFSVLEYPDIIFLYDTDINNTLINTIKLTDKGAGIAVFCLDSKTNDNYIYFDSNLAYKTEEMQLANLSKDNIVEIIGKMIRKNKKQLSLNDDVIDFKDIKIYIDMINLWDNYTEQHCIRTQRYASFIASKLNMTISEKRNITVSAALHDIGKIAIKKEILQKKEKLTKEEFELVKNHSLLAGRYLPGKQFNAIRELIVSHHENYDGTGYPYNLSGDSIPYGSYIIGIADAFDAMTTARGYNKVKNLQQAKEELLRCSGKQFHPELVEVFIDIIDNSPQFIHFYDLNQKKQEANKVLTFKKNNKNDLAL